MDEAQQIFDESGMPPNDAAEVVRRWVIHDQGRGEELAENVVATLKRDHLLSLPGRPQFADHFYPESNTKDLRELWRRTVAMMLQWPMEWRTGSNEGHFPKEVLDVLEKVIYPDDVEEELQGGETAGTQVPQHCDKGANILDQKQVSREVKLNSPMDLTRPTEAFSILYKTKLRDSELLYGATLQQSPGGHGLAFPSWITLPLSFVVPVGSPDYDIKDVKVTNGYVDNGHSRSCVVQDGIGFEWQLEETEVPNLQGFLKEMQKMAETAIYHQIDRLRFDNARKTLQSMKQKLWHSFKDTPLALWIEVHLAHVLLRVSFMDKKNGHTMFEEALQTFDRCLRQMRYGGRWQYLNRLYCSAYLGRAWYYLINGDLNEATQEVDLVAQYDWKEPRNQLSANISVYWARTAIFLSAGDIKNAIESSEKIGARVESTGAALNESQRMTLDIHIPRIQGELSIALAVCARCILSQEPDVQYDRITPDATKRVQEVCMGVIGDVWFSLGACKAAYQYYTMARKSEDFILRAAALVGRANVHMRLRKDKKEPHLELAERDYKESLSIYERLGHAEGKIIVHCNLGTLFMAQGQNVFSNEQDQAQKLFDQALHHYSQAREWALRVKLQPAIVELDCKMGQVFMEKRELRKAIYLLEKSQDLEYAKREPLVQAWIEHQLGLCLLKCSENEKGSVKAESLKRSEIHLVNAIKCFASVQLSTTGTEPHYERLWLTLFEEQKETYALLQWCLVCQKRPSDAVVWGERGRSRALMQEKWKSVMDLVADMHKNNLDPSTPEKDKTEWEVSTIGKKCDQFHSVLSSSLVEQSTFCSSGSPQTIGEHEVWMQNLDPQKFDELPCDSAWESLRRWNYLCDLNVGTAIVQYTICRGFGLLIYVLDGSSKLPSVYCKSFAELASNKINIRNVEDIEHLVVSTIDDLCADFEELEQTQLFNLSDLLLLPIEAELNKKQRLQNLHQLVFIPHEHLHRVPFPALYCKEQTTMLFKKKPRQRLVEKYTLSCVDSIRSLIRCSVLWKHACQKEKLHLDKQVAKSAALIVGIKDHQSDMERLPYAEIEAKEIKDMICQKGQAEDARPIQLLLGQQATKKFVTERLAQAHLVHFATHALMTTMYEQGRIAFAIPPELAKSSEGYSIRSTLSLIQLEELSTSSTSKSSTDADGKEVHLRTMRGHDLEKHLADEGFLDADEISGMKLTARLVVLSACETGRGVIAGEGVAGLGRALTRAGVPCTVLSLWPVQDGATKEIMVSFYKHLIMAEGMSVAVALQRAMVKMIHEPSSADADAHRWRVKHWAPFQTFGLPSVCLTTDSMH